MSNGDSTNMVTKGDFRDFERRLNTTLQDQKEDFKDHVRTQIELHSARCPARDIQAIREKVNNGMIPPIVMEHPVATIVGGGSGIGTVAFFILKFFMGG